MSCWWDVYCRTCDDGAGMRKDRGREEMMFLCDNREILARLGLQWEKLKEAPSRGAYLDLRVEFAHMDPLPLEWFFVHAGHDIVVRNEYGEMVDECNERITCTSCPADYKCRRPEGHEGEHCRLKQ